MRISTQQFGEIEFQQDRVITFDTGLLGFEKLTKFLLIKIDDEVFYWLNSIEEPEIVFPLIGVRAIDDKYPQEKNHEAFGIVTLSKEALKITVNLKAPVYINQDDKTGYQKIIDSEKYPVYHNLFKE
jgi:flagellar assembly factor FliW